jgi:hypothetical protein
MYAIVNIDKQETKTTIVIRPQKSIVFKFTLAILTLLLLPCIIFVIGLTIAGQIRNSYETYLIIGIAIILLIFLYKHLRAAFRKEILTIESNKLSYNNSFLGFGKYFKSDINKLKKFKYIGYSQQTKHPLEIKGDALGFGTQQGEMDYLNQIGTMVLITEFEVLKFGVDVDEEDYFKIKRLID